MSRMSIRAYHGGMKRFATLVFAAIAVAGCASDFTTVEQLDDGRMTITYAEPIIGPSGAATMIDGQLVRMCPNGYRKLDESAARNAEGVWAYTWTVRCH